MIDVRCCRVSFCGLLLFVVDISLCVVYLLCVVRCALFVARHCVSLLVVRCLLNVACCLLLFVGICCLFVFIVCGYIALSVVCCVLCVVCCMC